MKWSVGAQIASGFGLTLAILLVIGGVSYRSIVNLTDSSRWVEHTDEALAQLNNILFLVKDAEDGERGYLLTGDVNMLKPQEQAAQLVSESLQRLRILTADSPEQQSRLNDLAGPDNTSGLLSNKLRQLQQVYDLRQTKGLTASEILINAQPGKQTEDQIESVIGQMQAQETQRLDARLHEQNQTVRDAIETILLGTILAFLAVLLASFLITRNTAAPLRQITEVATRIASGDLSVDVASRNAAASRRADEVGELLRTFSRMTHSLRATAEVAEQVAAGNLRATVSPQSDKDVLGNAFATMIENLRQLTSNLMESVAVLGASSSQILASTTRLAANATETAAAVNETTTTVEEIRQTAQIASQKARSVAESAQTAARISQTGKQATEETVSGMKHIRQQMESIAESMMRLSEQSRAISEIITDVDDLAQQSNLLAVNAAIEAAKAGEQGKGFAVVAQQVRSLAEQSRQATAKVRGILGDITKATGAAVMATERGSRAVETGLMQSMQAGEALVTLSESVFAAAQAATQIAASSQQQLVGMDQMVTAMTSVKQASRQNEDGARQLDAAARGLTDLGQNLKQQVAQYQV